MRVLKVILLVMAAGFTGALFAGEEVLSNPFVKLAEGVYKIKQAPTVACFYPSKSGREEMFGPVDLELSVKENDVSLKATSTKDGESISQTFEADSLKGLIAVLDNLSEKYEESYASLLEVERTLLFLNQDLSGSVPASNSRIEWLKARITALGLDD